MIVERKNIVEMLRYIKKCFFTAISFFSSAVLNVNSLEYVSMNNQECKIRPKIINLNTNEPLFYPYSIKTNKYEGSCNTINDPYAKMCVPDNIKNTYVKVFNLISRINETRHIDKLVDKLVEEWSENIYENETLDIIPLHAIPLNAYKKLCSSCMVYIVLFVAFLITSICICCVFIYFHLILIC